MSKPQLLKFAFDLFDNDSNGFVCLQDLQSFCLHFGGVCDVLMSDFRTLMNFLLQKKQMLTSEGLESHINQ